jgi:hypothetical protein
LNVKAWRDLARAAANLNQIVKYLNEGNVVQQRLLSDELKKFRASLIGADRLDSGEGGDR